MKYVIAGAGAIGAFIGAKMSLAGEDVTLYARGAHLAAMQQDGIRVIGEEGELHAHPRIAATLEEIGPADVVFLCVKAHGLTALAPQLKPLLHENTVLVSTQNGIPWWYFQSGGGELAGLHLDRVDPGGVIAANIEPHRVLGSLIYFSTDVERPGVIRHTEGNRLSLGEPDGGKSDRSKAIGDALNKAGLRCRVSSNYRQEIWVKLLGNVAFNPISALTRATLVKMTEDPDVCDIVRHIMAETEAIAARLGVAMPVSIDQRIAGAAKMGEHKTSMLQDLELGRPFELEAIAGVLVELGERLSIPTPYIRTVYACAKLLDTTLRSTRT